MKKEYCSSDVAKVGFSMLIEIKKLGVWYSSTKKYLLKLKLEKFDAILPLEELVLLKFLKDSLLNEGSVQLFDYRHYTIPHIIIRLPKWRKFFKPNLSRKIPYPHLRTAALYTKIMLNANIIEAVL